jgi:hypothetical protein
MPKRRNLWIQKTHLKRGAFRRRLGVKSGERIPVGLAKKLKDAPLGSTVKNPYKVGRKEYYVDDKMKKEATLAHTLISAARRRRR